MIDWNMVNNKDVGALEPSSTLEPGRVLVLATRAQGGGRRVYGGDGSGARPLAFALVHTARAQGGDRERACGGASKGGKRIGER